MANQLTTKEKIKLILNKYPQTCLDRGKFMWRYILEFVVGKDVPYIMKKDFLAFWEHEATIERTLRDCLKERDLPKKAESQRYKKAQSFRGKYGLKNKEEEEQFKFIFGEETYENE